MFLTFLPPNFSFSSHGSGLCAAILGLLCCGTVPAVAADTQWTPGLSDEEIAEGWISLFDGKTLYGWRSAADVDWKVVDGTIQATSGKVGLLCTTTQFSDYTLRADFFPEAETNSGIFLRTASQAKSPTFDCYELNIAPPSNRYPTGSLVGREKVAPACEPGQWHTFEVTLLGADIEVKLDGETVLKWSDPEHLGKGFIGLQHNSGPIRFRNIALKPLGMQSLFDGETLDGWKTLPGQQSTFTVTPGREIRVTDGPGQLETEGVYGDFVLQLDAKTNAENLNSGVFFRSIPNDRMNGYESQIHNGIEAGDPTRPIDSGTGAIFRRTKARRVVSQDKQWLTKTLIAEGAHFSVWVNGYQVTDWTDTREKDENPRRGQRLEPGSIILQGHDPTTDVLFRNVKIAEIPARWPVERGK